jgi:predicted anti-sigma-YlaC factor YlaD
MKKHNEIRELLSLAAAGILDQEEQQLIQEHLAHCDACREDYNEWMLLANALRALPTPQAPQGLLQRTHRLVKARQLTAANAQGKLFLPCFLLAFSWISLFLNYRLLRLLDISLSKWIDISTVAFWITYIGVSWIAAAFAAGFLGRHLRQERNRI